MRKATRLNENMRRRLGDDQGFAMLSVVMLLIVMTVLSLVVLAVVLSQINPTLFSEKNARTLTAAQAGLDAAASQIRNAESPDGGGLPMGDIHKLPCSAQGTVDTTGGETSYVVAIQYFLEDPVGRPAAWRNDNALTCYTGTGINGGLRAVPRYAMLTSEGFDSTATAQVDRADRVVEASYTFQLTTRKVAGGMILDDNTAFCLVADGAVVGRNIMFRPASSPECQEPTDLNSWTWADDYMIHLSSTDLDGRIPLCLSGRATSATPTWMTLQTCATGSADVLGQRFSWTGAHTWRGQNSANTAYANSYIVNQDNVVNAGDRLSVSTAVGTDYRLPAPLPAVGKGNASYLTNQVVNYNQFGRCLDVTNEQITYSYMIAYPCKQDPSGNLAFTWNHKWYYGEPIEGAESIQTQIRVIPGATHCLITPSGTTTVNRAGGGTATVYFPRFVTGAGGIDCTSASTQWTRYGYSDDERKSYTIQDNRSPVPWCLSAGGPKTTTHPLWTTIVVEPCSGSQDQKWNVDPDPVEGSLGDFAELSGSRTG